MGTMGRIATFFVALPLLCSQSTVRTDLQVHDVYYSKVTNLLFVTTASNSPHAPNSLLALDPVTAQDVWQMDAGGSDPGEIAGSDDGGYAYVYLKSVALIRRFDLRGRTSDLQFPATIAGASGQIEVASMKVIQGDPETVAVSFHNPEYSPGHLGIALFHDGAQLPNTVPGSTSCLTMAYGATPSTMWCHNSESTLFTLYQLSVDANGIQTVGPGRAGLAVGFDQTPQFYSGRLFFNSLGLIVDPVQRLQVAMLPNVGTPTGDFTVDPDSGLVYFSRADGYERYFWALDASRFTPVGFVSVPQTSQWIKGSMTRCGLGGLAGSNEAGQLTIVPLSAIAALPLVTPGTPTVDSQGALRLAIPNQSLAYSPVQNMLYATVPDFIPGLGNSIVPLAPNSLTAANPLWIGSRPSLMGVTQDGQHLYQELDGANVLRRINLAPFTADLDIALYGSDGSPTGAASLVPLPGTTDSIAVLRGVAGASGIASGNAVVVYDDGVPRPQTARSQWDTVLALGDDGATLYGLNGYTTAPDFDSYAISPQGVSPVGVPLLVTQGDQSDSDLKCGNGICVTSYGIVIDAVNKRLMGVCPVRDSSLGRVKGSPLLDLPDRRAYFLIAEPDDVRITSCNLDTFLPAEQVTLVAHPEFNGNLILWQPDQFAFNTGNEVIVLPKSALAPLPSPRPQPSSGSGTIQLPLSVDYGVYDAVRDRLYVSLTYTNAGTSGNSIGVVRPDTGALESTIPVGGEPTMLALSSDASRIFVALRYAQAVVQVNLATQAIEQRILLNSDVSSLCAIPGEPTSLLIADQTSIRAFDNGVARPGFAQGSSNPSLLPATAITFGPTADSFYSLTSGGIVAGWQLTSTGMARVSSSSVSYPGTYNALSRLGNKLYTNNGIVLSLPSLTWIDQIASVDSLVADPVMPSVYAAWVSGVSVYSATTLAVTGQFAANSAQHRPLVPCGPLRLASLAGSIVFYTLSTGALPHLPSSVSPDLDGITRLNVPVSSVVWDARASQIVAAAIPAAAAGPDGNSLFSFDPRTGKLQIATRIDNQPSQISLAPDAHVAYVGTTGTGTLGRINLDSSAIERSWTLSLPNSTAVVPDQVVAVSASTDSIIVRASSRDLHSYLMALDNGKPRSSILGLAPNPLYGPIIAADNTGKHVYLGANSWVIYSTNGVSIAQVSPIPGLRGFTQAAACESLLYLNSGQVIDPEGSRIVADYAESARPYPGLSDLIACDTANDRVLYLTSTAQDYKLLAFQLSTGTAQGQLLFGNVPGSVVDLIAAGPSFAALRTDQSLLLLPLSGLTSSQFPPVIGAVVNAASNTQSGFAPGSIVTIFGSGLANWVAQANAFPLSQQLGDTAVSVGGQSAYPLYVSPTQANIVLPPFLTAGMANVTLWVGSLSVTTAISIVPTAPGLFVNGQHAVAQNEDYSTNSPDNPAAAGSVVMVYFTGQGQTVAPVFGGQSAPVNPGSNATLAITTATVGGQRATVLYSGLTPGLSGVAQANIQLPSLASGDYELVLTVGNAASNSALISVK